MKLTLKIPDAMANTSLCSLVAFKCNNCEDIHVMGDDNKLFSSVMSSLISENVPYVVMTRDESKRITRKTVQNVIDVMKHLIELNEEYLREKGL